MRGEEHCDVPQFCGKRGLVVVVAGVREDDSAPGVAPPAQQQGLGETAGQRSVGRKHDLGEKVAAGGLLGVR